MGQGRAGQGRVAGEFDVVLLLLCCGKGKRREEKGREGKGSRGVDLEGMGGEVELFEGEREAARIEAC